MGSGGGSPDWGLVISGQTGGRIIPGTHYGLNTSGTGMTQPYSTGSLASVADVFDYRTVKVSNFGDSLGAPGGGAGQPGMPGFDFYWAANTFTEPANGMLARFSNGGTIRSMAGTGGGWGAKGGDQYLGVVVTGGSNFAGITVGGAGGKAVNTSGFSVTWLGGQDRAYGVVG
jgi:hypothetical protein